MSHRLPPPSATPISESRQPGGSQTLASTPSGMPVSVIESGRMR